MEHKITQLEKDLLEKDLVITKLKNHISKPWWQKLFGKPEL